MIKKGEWENMKYKKSIILLVLAVFLLSITCVSASEIDDTLASEDTNTIGLSVDKDIIEDNLQTSEENDELASTDYDEAIAQTDTEVLGEDSAKYSDLAEEIRHSGNITLTHKNYTYDWGETITVFEANKVIDGNGAVIDMNGSTISAFHVSASGVTIKNLTIINVNYDGDDGGAIYFTSSVTFGTVTNCNFTDNTANYGGAIRFYGEGTVTNCNFADNKATRYGGAVYFVHQGTVTNCNFTGNTANYDGGAIRFNGEGTVTNCNFVDNKATALLSHGGAVYFYDDGTVSNCNFVDNYATYGDGGAVYFLDTGNVTNCNFTGNTVNYNGGAVYFYDDGTVSNCNFTGNTANYDGGAIRFNGEGNVTNCNFTNNKATGTGNYDGGGAVYFYSAGSVTNCNFTDNTATRDGGAVYFYQGTGSVTNCNFTDNTATYSGGAVYFWDQGNVTNCNFADNSASIHGGAVYFSSSTGTGTVSNCNFTNNSATENGGAVYFMGSGTVSNCNFVDNYATYGDGGAINMGSGSVSNCNFINNTALQRGGAVYFLDQGTVTNCNFTGNNATTGSAIYFYKWVSSDTLTVSNSTFSNNRANAGALDVVKNDNNITITFTGQNNLLNAIYSRNDVEVTFTNVTYWGADGITTVSAKLSGSNKAAGQNITVKGVVNGKIIDKINVTDENGEIVLDDAGDYWIIVSHKGDLYYTEIAETLFTNMKLYANVTSLTTNNKTVNITAKSNIYSEVMLGKLLFILLDGTADGMVIEANYSGNSTWWAKYTFADYGDYKVNATYVGLDNVTITNATISISKTPTEIIVENTTVELLVLDSVGTGAALKPADAGELTFTSSNTTVAKVEDGKIIAVGEGTALITVSFAGSEDYAAAENKTIIVNVIKYDSKVTISPINDTVYPNNVTIEYSVENKTNVTVTIDGVSDDKIIITNDTITVIGLDAGEYTITIINNESSIYHKSNDTKTFTVNKQATSITASDVSTTYNINKDLVITLKDSNGKALSGVKVTVDLNGAKTYTTDKNGQVKVSTKGLAPKAYTAKVTFNGDTNYDKSTKDIKVTVKKATPKLTAKKKTFKTTPKTKKYTITLKDNTGKAIKKAKVTLKVKGKTYKATTNSKGKAVFKIKKLNKKGTFKATITYKGNKYYNKITKKANIKVIVTFKTVSKGSKDKSTVKEIQQALKDHGYYLSYKGHYLKVDGKFQSCTERSVKEFQHDKGLKVTGKVDEKTAKKLGLI